MKKTLLIASALFMFSLTINAQETKAKQAPKKEVANAKKPQGKPAVKKTPEDRAKANTEHLNKVAGLSEEQKVKVNELALAKVQKMDAIREKYKGQPEQKETAKQEMEAVRKEFRQSVKALLTPEQAEKVKAKGREMKKAKQGKGEHAKANGHDKEHGKGHEKGHDKDDKMKDGKDKDMSVEEVEPEQNKILDGNE